MIIAPAAPSQISPRDTVIHRRLPLGSADSVVGYLATGAQAGDEVTILPTAVLPPEGLTLPATSRNGRVTLLMPGCTTTGLIAASGAQGYRVVGLEVTRPPVPDTQTVGALVVWTLGSKRIDFEGLTVRGTPTGNVHRGLALQGADCSFTKSKITGIQAFTPGGSQDTQGLYGSQGPGPYLLEDLEVDCGTEGILFGGEDPSTPNLIPADITLRRVTFTKPPAPGVRKNLFELKNAVRVVMEDCIFDWPEGVAIVLTPRNQSGTAPWCTVMDVLVRNCLFRHGGVFSAQTTDNERPSASMARVAFRNCLALDVIETGWSWGTGGPVVMEDFELDHCTFLGTPRQAFQLNGIPPLFRRVKITNNLLAFGAYTQQWIPALLASLEAEIRQNGLVNTGGGDGGGAGRNTGWPGLIPVNPGDIGLDVTTGRLAAGSAWANQATDGGPIGYMGVPQDEVIITPRRPGIKFTVNDPPA